MTSRGSIIQDVPPPYHQNSLEDGKEITNASLTPIPEYEGYPDGGLRAWLIVIGAMCCTCSTFGFVNSWGVSWVFQAYYETDLLPNSTPSQIIVAGRYFDLGYFKIPFLIGSIVLVLSTLLVSQCTQYVHFLLCQGFALGIASGICFAPTFGIIGHWFQRKRGLALGITTSGSAIGGTVFPIAARNLISVVGFQWAMRILALMILCLMSIANLTLARRLPPKDVPGGLLNLKIFKSPAFTVYCVANFVAYLAIYTVLTYIDVGAIAVGLPSQFSFYLISIANATSGFGRIATGILADKFGPLNVIIPMTLAVVGITFAWPHALDKSSLIVVAVLYGFTCAGYVSAFNLPVYDLGEMGDVGRRLGMVLTFSAFGSLAGPPISGAIIRSTNGFTVVSYVAGAIILLAITLMIATRQLLLRRLWGKV